ncbi:MAG: hypothetical protein JRJ84_16755 [Deltaproteobacteria bacterium]|nr:hypothetical protein [Deltaproteobacteria bacterium]
MHTPIRSLAFALTLALVSACGGTTPDGQLKVAEGHLTAGTFDQAATAAAEGLTANPSDAAIRWRLEFTLLEAQARGGDVAAATATLERLAALEGTQIKGTHYVSTADQLKGGGQATGAVELLDKGLKRFPDDADIAQAIERTKASGGMDELEALKSLGYLGE